MVTLSSRALGGGDRRTRGVWRAAAASQRPLVRRRCLRIATVLRCTQHGIRLVQLRPVLARIFDLLVPNQVLKVAEQTRNDRDH
jgi:hypothetical protein